MEILFMGPQIALDESGAPLAILKEKDGKREFAISLNIMSTALLLGELRNTEERPEIFKFTLELLQALNANIEKLVIYDIIDALFLAHIVIRDARADRIYSLKLHVTDALALAVAANCPIFIDDIVLNKIDDNQDDMSKVLAKKFLESLAPDKLTKH